MFNIFNKNFKKEEKSSLFKTNINWINPSIVSLEEAYYNNPIVFRCINLFIEYLHPINFISENNIISNYLKKNIKYIAHNLLVYGNCFIHKDLFFLSLYDLKILTHEKTNELMGYRLKDKIYDKSEVIHIKYDFNSYRLYGVSPIQVAMKSINLYNNIFEYLVTLVQSGGRPSGILSHEEVLTEQEKNKLKQDFKDIHTNFGHNVSLLMTGGSFKWQSIGCEPEKLELHRRLDETMRDISTVFGIPTMLLGAIRDNLTFSNFQIAREYMLEDIVAPFVHKITNIFESFFSTNIDFSCENLQQIDKHSCNLEKILTINERRSLFGFASISNGDKM
ncbi:hypothetical protein AB836_01925 [Rickettsiales bacterium (ex Bugula neritina AB1)]|nr:hypothetical protein AB836_01925 [Rickettsiales bacterium (ex Bugula neritina AB1)]